MVTVFCVAVAVVHVVNVVAVLDGFVTAVGAVGVFVFGVVSFAACSHDVLLVFCAGCAHVLSAPDMTGLVAPFSQIYKRMAIY